MARRRNEGSPVTLFSFQDIITSVMGIVILVMLVIALELAARELNSPAKQQAVVRNDVRETLTAAKERLEKIKKALQAGAWDNLAGLTNEEIRKETEDLQKLLPLVEEQTKQASQRVEQLQRRRNEASQALSARASDIDALRKMEQEVAELEEELAKLENSTAMFFRPSDTGGKVTWLVELSGSLIQAARLGPAERPISFSGTTGESRSRQFLSWAKQRKPSAEYFVLLIKPGGARLYNDIETELRDRGFHVGLDLLSADQSPIDPERGAPIIQPESR